MTCAYPGCMEEARGYCPKCFLPFCNKHLLEHGCLGSWIHLYTYERELKHRFQQNVSALGASPRLAVEPRFKLKERFEEYDYRSIAEEISKTYPNMSWFLHDLRIKVLSGKRMSTTDLLKYVMCKLYSKLLEFSKKHGRVIIMSREVYRALKEFPKIISPRIGGLAFQWWISLEILDSIMSRPHCKLEGSNYKKKLFQFTMQGDNVGFVSLWTYFDSFSRNGLRPDVYAQLWEHKSSQSSLMFPIMCSEKVIEIKLSQSALEKSMDRFKRYLDEWGARNIALAIGTPCSTPLNVKKYDSLIIMEEDALASTLERMVKFLLTY